MMISVKCPNILIHAGQSPPGQGPVSVGTQNFYDALAMDRAQGVHPHVGVFEQTTATDSHRSTALRLSGYKSFEALYLHWNDVLHTQSLIHESCLVSPDFHWSELLHT